MWEQEMAEKWCLVVFLGGLVVGSDGKVVGSDG